MDATLTELLARVEILEDDVRQLQQQIDEAGIVFECDIDLLSPDWLLEVDEDNKH
jgi:hypothetical protein